MFFISLTLSLISMLDASLVQASFAKTTVKYLTWEIETGYVRNANLFISENASVDNKTTAIVTSHGWYNTRKMHT